MRTYRAPSLGVAPQFLAEPPFHAEGLTDVEYLDDTARSSTDRVDSGEIDMLAGFSAPSIVRVDAGAPVVSLAGLHVGCFGLVGTDQVRAIRDLKWKTVAVLRSLPIRATRSNSALPPPSPRVTAPAAASPSRTTDLVVLCRDGRGSGAGFNGHGSAN